jgi:hypothetical protein
MFETKVAQKIKTHVSCSLTFLRKLCHLSDNVEKYGAARDAADNYGGTQAHARSGASPLPPTRTQKCVTLIVFRQQQWLRKRTSVLRYTYIGCLLFPLFIFILKIH